MAPLPTVFAFLLMFGSLEAASRETEALTVNPIRRVVSMLQMMQKKISAEGEKEKELYEKFQCYCKGGSSALQGSIGDANTKIPQLKSDLDAAGADKAQLASDVVQHTADRDAAKAAMKEATGIREKDASAFASMKADADANIDAMSKAINAISNGMSGGFLQTAAASVLRNFVEKAHVDEGDREVLTSFLSQGEGYAPASGQIVGILKQMKDTWTADLADATAAEEKAIKDYDGLMAAKKKLVDALQQSIEEKTTRLGETGVQIVNIAEDLDDTKKALGDDKNFLANLESSCKTKTAEWEARSKTRSQELLALADTIKILNDDDALELLKKTLPTPALLQVRVSSKEVLQRAQQVLKSARKAGLADNRLDLISLALHGRKVSFTKVIKMIDDMVALLGEEQVDDEAKKAYCEKEFDESEDEQKVLARSIDLVTKAIDKNKAAIQTLTEEIAALTEAIKDTDTRVSESTEQRKDEHADYLADKASNTAALKILGLAKNRLNQFYNPKLYKAPPKQELSSEARIVENMGGAFVQIRAHTVRDAPAPPPETWDAYQKKGGESSGVISMIDLLNADLNKEMQENEVDEKNAQEEYEQFMSDSATRRADDSKLLAEKESTKADAMAAFTKNKQDKKDTLSEAYANDKYIHNLHGECDWLIMNFDTRKAARAGEVESLKNAKAVLSGADYALVQGSRA
jgi:hypothetical protein